MPKKAKKSSNKKSNGKNSNENGNQVKEKKEKKKTGKKGRGGGKGGKNRCNMDIFSEGAMEHAYYTCHNIQDVLICRGFPWPDLQKKKKGKKK